MMKSAARVVLSVLMFLPAAIKGSSAASERPIPEFIATKVANVCDIEAKFSVPNRAAIFDFLDAAFSYTNHWRQKFVVVGVDYITNDSLHVIDHAPCSRNSEGAQFLLAHFGQGNGQCRNCERPELTFTVGQMSPFIASRSEATFTGKRQMFLHYRPKSMLSTCAVSFRWIPQPISRPASANLGGYISGAQYIYRIPINEVSQGEGGMHYVIFSRQCYAKRVLYETLLAGIRRLGGDPTMMENANYNPKVPRAWWR